MLDGIHCTNTFTNKPLIRFTNNSHLDLTQIGPFANRQLCLSIRKWTNPFANGPNSQLDCNIYMLYVFFLEMLNANEDIFGGDVLTVKRVYPFVPQFRELKYRNIRVLWVIVAITIGAEHLFGIIYSQ